MSRLVIALLSFAFCTVLMAQKKPKPQLYVPMDYSTCGYHASEQPLPDVPVMAYVEWQEGDCSATIQKSIDEVSARRPDGHGLRGAVLIGEGVFRIDEPLRISASGVVLRGMGRDRTRLVKHGVDRGALLYIEGCLGANASERWNATDTIFIKEEKIPAGSTKLYIPNLQSQVSSLKSEVSSLQSPVLSHKSELLSLNSRIDIVRPCTKEWIESLGMGDFGGGLDYTGWKPTDIDIRWDRTITDIIGDTIIIDAPVTTTISQEFGGAYIARGRHDGEISECGIENITLASAVNDWNPKDEDHCWDAIYINNVRDSWVRRVNFLHFAGSAVNLQKQTSRITVEDCISQEPLSEIGGWRRQTFLTRGQQTLFQRCISRQGIHDFAAGFCAAGPNAFVQCEGEQSLGFSGSIGSWAAGLLLDIVNIDGHDIHLGNLEQFQFGTGWNTANSMLWQCTASTIWCYSPDPDNRCSAHGCWGTLTGNANWTSSNDHVQPRSLFYHQLYQRLQPRFDTVEHSSSDKPRFDTVEHGSSSGTDIGANASERLNSGILHGFILPRPTNATSSPTVEQAMQMAQESLTQPRLTMEMWIDSIPFTAPIERPTPNPSLRGMGVVTSLAKDKAVMKRKDYQLPSITGRGRVWVCQGGSQYSIPWWSGRVKDNFCQKEAKPAITRFVPGREGTGWTDRIDSVVDYLARNHYSSLYHNYGLWYDLRRTDHERVRRADGDVWAPFYEQPFARSGQGTAWDGLSRYDLTRPNQWYWHRLRQFADKAQEKNIVLFHNHYFQHNILEAGAHWVDCPWRPVNNINMGDNVRGGFASTPFPEPVPFAGDKRIFIAEQFYDIANDKLRDLHRQYIRMCLDELKDQPNVVHLLGAEYTGPLHFTRFWLQTIAEWEQETGRHPLIALSCTRDAQDSILADPVLCRVVDIIDIRYWHYNTEGLWAPEAGKNLAPRQWMRKMKVGKTGFNEAYRAVREMRDKYPDKAVTFFSQQFPSYGWAILLAGGSLPNVSPYSLFTFYNSFFTLHY